MVPTSSKKNVQSPSQSRKERKDRAAIKQQIVDRITAGPKPNPNAPKKRATEGTFRAARLAAGITMTSIQRDITAAGWPMGVPVLDADGNEVRAEWKRAPAAKVRQLYVDRGLLAPMASATERRKVRRRNNRHAACNVAVKKNRAAKKPAVVETPKKKAA